MPLYRCTALILKTYPYREADQIVVFFGAEEGLRRGLARRSRRIRSRLGAALQPLRLAQFVFFAKPTRELVTIDSADTVERFPRVEGSLELLGHGLYLLELVLRSAAEAEPNPPLFRLVHKSLRLLDRGAVSPWLLRCYAQLHVLRLAGFAPELETCTACGAAFGERPALFDRELGRFDCPRCARSRAPVASFSPAERRLLRRLRTHPLVKLPELEAPGADLEQLCRSLGSLLEYHLESRSRVESFERELGLEP
jgi:DNA repair protein RecO (recombination protein O)